MGQISKTEWQRHQRRNSSLQHSSRSHIHNQRKDLSTHNVALPSLLFPIPTPQLISSYSLAGHSPYPAVLPHGLDNLLHFPLHSHLPRPWLEVVYPPHSPPILTLIPIPSLSLLIPVARPYLFYLSMRNSWDTFLTLKEECIDVKMFDLNNPDGPGSTVSNLEFHLRRECILLVGKLFISSIGMVSSAHRVSGKLGQFKAWN